MGNDFSSNTVGNYNSENEFESNLYYSEFTNLIEGCSISGGRWNIKVVDSIRQVVIPAEQLDRDGAEIRCYNPGSNENATIIKREGYGQETAVSTTDGGQTWTAV